ncbi:MAG TPA: RlpA-like double-psi beta-barrel domain-containing protein [Chloroflexota bacterium]|jgi:rare lipoprotein A (peptidoglycan hydrolase)
MPHALRALCALALGAALFAPRPTFASSTGTTATYYHPSLQGFRMANGLPYNRWDPMIAANNWYPLGTLLKVTRQGSNRYLYVRVQDRGSRGLTLDLSEAGFAQLGGLGEGRIPVWLEVVNTIEGQEPRSVAPQPDAAPEDAPDAEPSVTSPTVNAPAPDDFPVAPPDLAPRPVAPETPIASLRGVVGRHAVRV